MVHNGTRGTFPTCTLLLHGFNLADGFGVMHAVSEPREELLVSRLLGQLREGGMTRALRASGDELARHFGASEVVLAIRTPAGTGFLWRCSHGHNDESAVLEHAELTTEQIAVYFAVSESDWLLTPERNSTDNDRWTLMVNGSAPGPAPTAVVEQASRVTKVQPLQRLYSVSVPFMGESAGRLFVVNPSARTSTAAGLRSLVAIARQAGPTLLAQYELRALEGRVEAEARARVARELHDGVIQSLIAVQMRAQVLQRLAPDAVPSAELQLIQEELREPITALRELTEHLRQPQLAAHELMGRIRSLVETFARVTGIATVFEGEDTPLDLSPRRCREAALVIQEALLNVQRHSGARSVKVHVRAFETEYELGVEDDGKGFPFAGRFSHDELEHLRQGPRVIKERVKALGGALTIESTPDRGSRLVITVPRYGASARV